MISNISGFDLVCLFCSLANTEQLESVLHVIERPNLLQRPEDWLHRGEGRRLATGRCGLGADYMFCNT